MWSKLSTYSLLALTLATAACKQSEPSSPLVASVYGHELRQSDLEGLVDKGVTPEDSAAIIDNYVEQWVRQTVVLCKAEKNVTDNFDRQMGEYRNSLLTYAYEQQILNQLMDTVVTDDQIADYYAQHQSEFRLRNSIVKAVYTIAPKKFIANTKIKQLITKRIFVDEDIVALEELASRYGLQGYYDGDAWITFYTLQGMVPITTYNENLYLRQNRSIVLSDDSITYYVRILDYKVSDDASPLELEHDNIRAIILNHRKLDILNKMQSDLMREAESGGHVKRVRKSSES